MEETAPHVEVVDIFGREVFWGGQGVGIWLTEAAFLGRAFFFLNHPRAKANRKARLCFFQMTMNTVFMNVIYPR